MQEVCRVKFAKGKNFPSVMRVIDVRMRRSRYEKEEDFPTTHVPVLVCTLLFVRAWDLPNSVRNGQTRCYVLVSLFITS